MYYIKSSKGYWKPKAMGYTNDKELAGTFSFKAMHDLGLNLDDCTLERVDTYRSSLVNITEQDEPKKWSELN